MKSFFCLLFFLIFCRYSFAQNNTAQVSLANYEQKAQLASAQMNNLLNLNSIQMDSSAKINQNYYYQIALLKDSSLNLTERNNRLLVIENNRKYRLGQVFTTEQYNQYFNVMTEKKLYWQHRLDSLHAIQH